MIKSSYGTARTRKKTWDINETRRTSTSANSGAKEFPHAPIIEPAVSDEKERLERDCERILSMENISANDFNSYVDKMIKILGSGGPYSNPHGRNSDMVQRLDNKHSIGITFIQDPPSVIGKEEEQPYRISVHSEPLGEEDEILPANEEIRLYKEPEIYEGEYFSKTWHGLLGDRFKPQYFSSIIESYRA